MEGLKEIAPGFIHSEANSNVSSSFVAKGNLLPRILPSKKPHSKTSL